MRRIEPGHGQESVWDYPRPPRVEPTARRIRVMLEGHTVADSRAAQRVLETTHPPSYYIPPDGVDATVLRPTSHTTVCEYKGTAAYYDVTVGDRTVRNAAWTYHDPKPGYEAIADHIAFYPWAMDECLVDEERATAQAGHFYGGWITGDIVGPFKGDPGTMGW